VVAELAITVPGQPPVRRALAAGATNTVLRIATAVTGTYMVAWLATGLYAFVVGYLRHPDVLKPLTDLGQAWLGIAVAAGYAYFALQPPNGKTTGDKTGAEAGAASGTGS